MSHRRKTTIIIGKRAAYFLLKNTSKTNKVICDRVTNTKFYRTNDLDSLRRLITRCYQIS